MFDSIRVWPQGNTGAMTDSDQHAAQINREQEAQRQWEQDLLTAISRSLRPQPQPPLDVALAKARRNVRSLLAEMNRAR